MPYSVDYFNKFTLQTLRDICANYNIKNYSKIRDKKQLLAEYICENLNMKNIEIDESLFTVRKSKAKSKALIGSNSQTTSLTNSGDSSDKANDTDNEDTNEIIDKKVFNPPTRIININADFKADNADMQQQEIIYDIVKEYSITETLSKEYIEVIYHISDIHIHPYLNRSDFYHFDDVFNKLSITINKNDRKKLLVITGDIFDHKSKITATSQRKFQEYMENIKCDKIIILGNHDKELSKQDAIDNLEPVISGYKDIHYLKYSGIYQYGNIDFYVSSLLDDKIYPVIEKNNKYNICLYHGMLRGTASEKSDKLDNFHGQILKDFNNNEKIKSIKEFNNYDYVLLGDIHKRQYLDKENTAWYAGSLLQKNFGENIDGHGFVLLDLENKNPKFYNIKSDYGYLNIILDNENYSLQNELEENLCKNMKIKYKINLNVKDKNQIFKKIKEDLKISIIDKKEELILNNNIIDNIKNDDNIPNLLTNEIEEFEKYLFENKERLSISLKEKLTDDILNEVIKLHKENIKNYDDGQKGNIFELLSIEFKNLLKFGNNNINSINFNKGLYIIQGQNAIGKSSIIKLIQFGLFGIKSDIDNLFKVINKHKRNKINDNFIHISFKINNDIYRIERNKIQIDSNISKKASYGNVLLKKNDTIITTDKNSLDKEIKLILDTNSNFKNISLLNETEKQQFINTSNKYRFEYFSELLGLNKYTEFETIIKNLLTTIRKEYNKLDGEINVIKQNIKIIDNNYYNNLKDEILKLQEEYIKIKDINIINIKEKDKLENLMKELYKKLVIIDKDIKEVNINIKEDLIKELDKLISEIENITNKNILLENLELVNKNQLILNDKLLGYYSNIYNQILLDISKISEDNLLKIITKKNSNYIKIDDISLFNLYDNYNKNIDKLKKINVEKTELETLCKNYITNSNIIDDETYNIYIEKRKMFNNIYNKQILENLKFKTDIININNIKELNIEDSNNLLNKLEDELIELEKNINELSYTNKLLPSNIINYNNYNYYSNIFILLEQSYSENIENNIDFKTNLLEVDKLEIIDISNEFKNLQKYEYELKEIISKKLEIGKIEKLNNNTLILDKILYKKAKLYNTNIEKVLNNNIRNIKDNNKVNINLDKDIENYNYYKILNELNNVIIQYECEFNNLKDIEFLKCEIKDENNFKLYEEKYNNNIELLKELEKKELIYLINPTYDTKDLDNLMNNEYINKSYMIDNIDNLYHYIYSKKDYSKNKDKLLKENSKLSDEIEKYNNNKQYIIKQELFTKIEEKKKEKLNIEKNIDLLSIEYNFIKLELLNYENNAIILEKDKKLKEYNSNEEFLNKKILKSKCLIYNIIYYYHKIKDELSNFNNYKEYLLKKKKLKELTLIKKDKLYNIDNIRIQLYNISYYYKKCKDDIDNYLSNNKYKDYIIKLEKINKDIITITEENKDIIYNINILYSNYLIIKDEILLFNKNLEYNNNIKLLNDNKKILSKLKVEKDKIETSLKEIGEYENYSLIKENNLKIEKELYIYESELKNINNNINIDKENNLLTNKKLKEKDYELLTNTINENKEIEKILLEKNNNFNKIHNNLIINELYNKILKNEEFPSLLANHYINKIEYELNKHIKYFMNDKIIFRANNKNLLLYKENIDGGIIDLRECSNYEQVVICGLIKLIFKNNNMFCISDIMMIDEVLDCINELNYDKIKILIDILEKNYNKIMIITHNNDIKDVLNEINYNKYLIKIENKNDKSYIL